MSIFMRPVRTATLAVMVLAAMFVPATVPTMAHQPAVTNPCLDFSIPPATGSITGRVTYADTGQPAADVFVDAVIVNEFSFGNFNTAYTDSTGVYTITKMYAGTYVVEFSPSAKDQATYASEYYSDQATFENATTVNVADNTVTTGIDEALEHGAPISGKVVAADTGQPLAGVAVDVEEASTAGQPVSVNAITDKDGNYTTSALKAGSYKLFIDPVGEVPDKPTTGYLYQYYNGKPTADTADVVKVTGLNPTTGINAAVTRGATLSGTVTSGGKPLPKVIVVISGSPTTREAATDAAGQYTFLALPSGSYKVSFQASPDTAYVSQYYNNKPSSAQADSIAVTAPNTIANINADLQVGGRITGRVTDPAGNPLASTYVGVFDSAGQFVGSGDTDATGMYTTTGMLSGSYRVEFSNAYLVPQYYDNKSTLADADPVAVTAPNLTSNINAKLVAGGCIGGQVTDTQSGKPIPNATITVYDRQGNQVAKGSTDHQGNYTSDSLLAPGSYRVKFSAPHYADQYFDKQSTLAGATPIVVAADAKATANGALGPAPTAKLTYLPLVKR